MVDRHSKSQSLPRIVPVPGRIRGVLGIWRLNGSIVRLQTEPDTGVLLAITLQGEQVNPLRVISRGEKLEDEPEF